MTIGETLLSHRSRPCRLRPFVKDGLDQLRLGQAGARGRAAEHLLRPEIGLQIDLEEVERAGLGVEAEFEAAIIERAIFLGHLQGEFGDHGGTMSASSNGTSSYLLARSTRSRFS